MKIITTTLIVMLSLSFSFSQKKLSEAEKYSVRLIQKINKGNVWVMDEMKSYTGQGTSDWLYDYHEDILSRNSQGMPTIIETEEKIEGTASWENVYRAEITYYNNDTTSEYTLKAWDASNWTSDYIYYETKDENGNILIHYQRDWDVASHSFISGNKEIYSYNANGYKTQKLDNNWNNGTWESFFKTLYYYDANNNDTLELQKRYISSNNWRDNWKTAYTYNSENQKIKEQQWWYDSYLEEWFNDSRTTYTYYANGFLKEEYTERYDNSKSGWYDLAKTKYYYNANNLLDYKEELDLQNDGNNLKYEYTYNADNQENTFFWYSWNGSEWGLFYKVYDNYDANGNQISYYSQTFDGTWKNFEKEEYYWSEITVKVDKIKSTKIELFPNPANNYLNLISGKSVNVEIVNALGQNVYKSNNKVRNLKVNISTYPAGVYFLSVDNNKTFKFLKK